jgi:hypothetical protein
MNPTEQQRYNNLYQQHLTNLTLQGKRKRQLNPTYQSTLTDVAIESSARALGR